MLKPILARLLILLGFAAPLTAQVFPQADPAKMAALAANSQRTLKPASFALSHKTELSLTDKQVQQLELLAKAQDDSAAVREFRRSAQVSQMMEKHLLDNNELQTGWNGPVNESQLRENACEQAKMAADAMVNLYRDRQAAGKFLTGKQITLLVEIEMSDMMRILRPTPP
jgi:hypothetical protein